MVRSGKCGKTSYSPAARLKMKMEAEKPQKTPKTKVMEGSVQELMRRVR